MNAKDLSDKFKNSEFRNQDHAELFEKLCVDLQDIIEGEASEKNQETLPVLGIFRVLRNCCIQCCKNQNALLTTKIPDFVIKILLDHRWENCDEMHTAGLQFLGNFVAGNAEAQTCIWRLGFPDFFKNFILGKEVFKNHFSICTMILYNCLNEERVNDFLTDSCSLTFIPKLCEALLNVETDWVILSINDYFLKNCKFLPIVLSKCLISTQSHVLEMYCDLMEDINNSNNIINTIFIIKHFLQQYKTPSLPLSNDFLDHFEILLKTLCWATAIPGKWSRKPEISELVDCTIRLLGSVTGIGKKLAPEIPSEGDRMIAGHMASSFGKRDLVRLVGNLCFDNPTVQNQIRSLGGISLVLEACNIDDGNPFMQQWAVFAIRNLCQNNLPNQEEIAKLEKLGVADSPVLKSMGLTATQDENGKMRVVPSK